jgi:branched-chain amino acid transport system permease protein
MDRFIFLTVDGLSHGAIYAAFALALVLIWRGARVVNFAQGAMAVAAAYIAYSVTGASGSYWLGAAAAVVAGLVIGVVVERGAMRFVEHTAPLTAIVVALGLALFIQAVLGMVYGVQNRPFPTPLSTKAYTIGGHDVFSPYDLFVFAVVAIVLVGIGLLFRRTSVGLRMRAAAFAPETARLLGVNTARVLTLGWALAAAVGAIASLLILPTGFLNPNAMDLVFVSSFTAAVIGGLDSPVGAVIGGLGLGLVLSYASGYLGSDFTSIGVLILLVLVLLVRPNGVLAATRARRV